VTNHNYERLLEIFKETRGWRLEHRVAGRQIEAAYCACREQAILHCMLVLGMVTVEETIKMEKLEWKS
jgi:hypothetical protein